MEAWKKGAALYEEAKTKQRMYLCQRAYIVMAHIVMASTQQVGGRVRVPWLALGSTGVCMCTDTCVDVCMDMSMHMCKAVCIAMCIDMCMAMCIVVCIVMCIVTCIDMHIVMCM